MSQNESDDPVCPSGWDWVNWSKKYGGGIGPPAPLAPTALRDEDWLREVAKEWMGNHFSNTLSRLELRRAKSKLIVDFESKHISRALKIISITKIWTDRFQYQRAWLSLIVAAHWIQLSDWWVALKRQCTLQIRAIARFFFPKYNMGLKCRL